MGVLTIISLIIAVVAMIRVKDQERALQELAKKVEQLQQLATQNKLTTDVNSPQISHTQDVVQNIPQAISQENSQTIPQTISQSLPQSTLPENGQIPPLSQDSTTPQPLPISPPITAEQSPQLSPKVRSKSPDESSPNVVTSLVLSIKNWFFGENLVVRVGALVLLVGVVLLLKLASQYLHISLANRMLGIVVAGVAVIAVGYRLAQHKSRPRKNYGITLQGVGFSMIYLTVFASFRLYQLLPPQPAFALLAVVAGITVLLSVRQNALPLAVLAFGGAFFAPILVNNPHGSVVMLFGYYLLLNVAVAVIAYFRTWKLLNALSLLVTFGLAYVWGFGQYVATLGHQGQTGEQGGNFFEQTRWQLLAILLAHIGLYLFMAVRYTQQVITINQSNSDNLSHPFGKVKSTPFIQLVTIDSGLLLGTAILGIGLLAGLLNDLPHYLAVVSAVLAGVYLGVGFWLNKQAKTSQLSQSTATPLQKFYHSYQLLIETTLALGTAFLVLVIPLALSARWVSVGWAIQGASLVWLGYRTARQWTVWFGLVLQAITAVIVLAFAPSQRFWYAILDGLHVPHAPMITDFSLTLPIIVLTLAVACSAFVLRFGIVDTVLENDLPNNKLAKKDSFLAFSLVVATGICYLISVYQVTDDLYAQAQFYDKHFALAFAVAMAVFALLGTALHTRLSWIAMRQFNRLTLPVTMGIWTWVWFAWFKIESIYQLETGQILGLQGLGKGLFGMALVLIIAKTLGGWLISQWHKDGVKTSADQLAWLLSWVGMATLMLLSIDFQNGELTSLLMILPSVLVGLGLLGLVHLERFAKNSALPSWLSWLNPNQLLQNSRFILIPVMWLWLMVANFTENGQLLHFYVPILNPLDILLVAVLAYLGYLGFVYQPTSQRKLQALFAISVFWTVSSLLIRSFASFLHTPIWNDGAWQVGEVQTGLTILWAILATGLMFFATKKAIRELWYAGMTLLGVVVIKLVMVDMSHTTSILRVISFIGAGGLMLLIGYLAPLPPVKVSKVEE